MEKILKWNENAWQKRKNNNHGSVRCNAVCKFHLQDGQESQRN